MMLGKMESSLWRPLQIAIMILVLTSTVLCNKNKPDVGDDCWKMFRGTEIIDGKRNPAKDVADCKSACLKKADCRSIDFDRTTKDCFLHKTQDPKQSAPDFDHYDLVCDVTTSKKPHSTETTTTEPTTTATTTETSPEQTTTATTTDTSALTACALITTSTSKLEFVAPGYKRCITQEHVTMTNCSGSCPSSDVVGGVYVDDKRISPQDNRTCNCCSAAAGRLVVYDADCVADDGKESTITVDVEEFTECVCKQCQVTTPEQTTTATTTEATEVSSTDTTPTE